MHPALLLAALLGAAGVAAGAPGAERPNVVLILVDDLRWDCLSPDRPAGLETPHLDRLVREGARFTNAFVTTSMCCPSRAALLTGLYAHETGIHSNRETETDFQERHGIFPELLQEAGYETALVGKWHIHRAAPGPRRGFDHWAGFEGQGDYFDQILNVDGVQVETRGHSADVLTDHAVEWIAQRGDKPFFLLLSFKNCHLPFVPPARHRGMLAGVPLAWPVSFSEDPDALLPPARDARLSNRNRAPHVHPELYLDVVRAYWELLPSVDDSVGRVLAALEARAMLDETVVIFTSDNGYMLGEHGLTQKQFSYDPSIRVPLLVRYPELAPAGSTRTELVLNVDVTATVLDLAGASPLPGMRGRSLAPRWRGSAEPWRTDFLYLAPWTRVDAEFRELAVRGTRWKYVVVSGDGGPTEKLFDLAQDPGELLDLSASAEHEDDLERMRTRLAELRSELDIPADW